MNKWSTILTGLVFILLVNCASASFTQTGQQKFPKYEGGVEVLAEVPSDLDYVQIGIITSKGGAIHGDADLIKAIQKKAAKKGANAIILISNRETQSFVSSQYYTGSTSQKEMTANAIHISGRN